MKSLSSNESKQLLYLFLMNQISLENLLKKLSGFISVDFSLQGSERRILHNELEGVITIQFEPKYLTRTIEKYLEGFISEKELSDWAAFIFLSDLFVPEGETEEEQWEAGDGPVWDILQQLSTPSVFGGLGYLKAKEYMNLLRH